MTKKKSLFKNTPLSLLAVGFASLALNVLFIGTIIVGNVLESNGSLDYATAYSGIDRMCSEQFREKVQKDSDEQGETANEKGLRLALVDFPCSNNGAKQYYQDGYKAYARSLGLTP